MDDCVEVPYIPARCAPGWGLLLIFLLALCHEHFVVIFAPVWFGDIMARRSCCFLFEQRLRFFEVRQCYFLAAAICLGCKQLAGALQVVPPWIVRIQLLSAFQVLGE